MRVLVTRPRGDAEETAAKLSALGHEAVVAPLLEIRFLAGDEIVLDGVQAVLVTSANGIRALARRTSRRDVLVCAVGAQSAEAARKEGFETVCHAAGDAAALAKLAIERLTPEHGALLHAAGAETRGSLAEALIGRGFAVRSEVLYDAAAPDVLPAAAQDALARSSLEGVLFFSPRTARIFAMLVGRAGLEAACRELCAFCISQAAAKPLPDLGFRAIRVAPRPDQDSLLALLL